MILGSGDEYRNGREGPIVRRLQELIRDQVNSVFTSDHTGVDDLRNAINAVQGRFGAVAWGEDMTDTPFVDFLTLNGERTRAVAYLITAGSEAIPDSHAYIDFYIQRKGQWHLAATEDSDFRSSTFYVEAIDSGLAGEVWYLAYGMRIGDTGARLHLRVYAFNDRGVRTVWARSELRYGTVKATRRGIQLDYEPRDPLTYRSHVVREELHLTPNGFE